MSRKDISSKLTTATTYYWTKKLFSSYVELGMCSRKLGTLRADVISMNMKKEIVITEIKSGWQDFNSDKKWRKYLDYCNKFYFCFTQDFWEQKGDVIKERLEGTNAGVMILSKDTGRLLVVKNAKKSKMKKKKKSWVITKLAWAGGISKKTQKRTSKVFI